MKRNEDNGTTRRLFRVINDCKLVEKKCACGHAQNKHMSSWDRHTIGACIECECLHYDPNKVWTMQDIEKFYKQTKH